MPRSRYVAWGGNGSGELGAAVGSSTRTPTLGGAVDLVQIDVGRGNTCGRTRAGTVLCWGADDAGQLGNGLPFAGGPGAVQVRGITDAIDVSVGHWHACAVLSTGGVRCWGYRGSTGSLGDGVAGVDCGFYGCTPDQTTAYSAVPVEVVGIADARDVACIGSFLLRDAEREPRELLGRRHVGAAR